MGLHKSKKRSTHITCSYARVSALIMLKIDVTSTTYVRKLNFNFEKDPFSGSREIDVLLHGCRASLYLKLEALMPRKQNPKV